MDHPRCEVGNRPTVEECGDLETEMVQRKAPPDKRCLCWKPLLALVVAAMLGNMEESFAQTGQRGGGASAHNDQAKHPEPDDARAYS